ncbi:cytosine-specific methyltransferase domain protein [Mycobacterium xenopi 3993]|nr:cytosine-specific methyltransferase domain protein [Mycobacterium xenopi 3993]
MDGVDLPATFTDVDGHVIPGPFKTIDLHLGRRPTQLSLDRYAAIPPGVTAKTYPTICWPNVGEVTTTVLEM